MNEWPVDQLLSPLLQLVFCFSSWWLKLQRWLTLSWSPWSTEMGRFSCPGTRSFCTSTSSVCFRALPALTEGPPRPRPAKERRHSMECARFSNSRASLCQTLGAGAERQCGLRGSRAVVTGSRQLGGKQEEWGRGPLKVSPARRTWGWGPGCQM